MNETQAAKGIEASEARMTGVRKDKKAPAMPSGGGGMRPWISSPRAGSHPA